MGKYNLVCGRGSRIDLINALKLCYDVSLYKNGKPVDYYHIGIDELQYRNILKDLSSGQSVFNILYLSRQKSEKITVKVELKK
jgi:hypothetical protein